MAPARRRVLYYAHQHGAGHLRHAAGLASTGAFDVTVVTAHPRAAALLPADVPVIPLPSDLVPGHEQPARSPLHWSPVGPEIRARFDALHAAAQRVDPDVCVVDVSVEAALFLRLAGWPVLHRRMHGERTDPAHALVYAEADGLFAHYAAELEVPAWRAAHDHGDQPTVAVVKHANPCGIAVGPDIATAHERAHACDPVSAFGGIIAANREVTEEMASTVAGIFTEVVIAPSFAPAAVELLTAKKNIRLLTAVAPQRQGLELRPISGGLLVQQRDVLDAPGDAAPAWEHVSGEPADEAQHPRLVRADPDADVVRRARAPLGALDRVVAALMAYAPSGLGVPEVADDADAQVAQLLQLDIGERERRRGRPG